jgi:dipeptide/tripeptide permease
MFIVLGSGLFKTCISVMVGPCIKKAMRAVTAVSRCSIWASTWVVHRAADLRLAD